MATPRPAVSEAALEFLLIELVRTYHARGEEGRRTMEQMGFQVGTQLAERCVLRSLPLQKTNKTKRFRDEGHPLCLPPTHSTSLAAT